jgi:hypothetical protein
MLRIDSNTGARGQSSLPCARAAGQRGLRDNENEIENGHVI